ncbi:MAG: glycosyltransferase [Rhodocyclaceae bacterium]
MNVHMLWVAGSLSRLEYQAIASFVRQGFDVQLWHYGELANVPEGVCQRDAREVLPESSLFLNRQGSYAGFSDLFRYAVLGKFGGLYSDVDVVALRPASEMPQTPFLVTERMRDGRAKINGNVIHLPDPKPGDLIDLAAGYATAFPKDKVFWSEIGPALLTAIAGIYPQHGFDIKPVTFANPVNWWDCPQQLLAPAPAPEQAHFLHLYNEMWRRSGADKNQPIPPDSMLARALGGA